MSEPSFLHSTFIAQLLPSDCFETIKSHRVQTKQRLWEANADAIGLSHEEWMSDIVPESYGLLKEYYNRSKQRYDNYNKA